MQFYPQTTLTTLPDSYSPSSCSNIDSATAEVVDMHKTIILTDDSDACHAASELLSLAGLTSKIYRSRLEIYKMLLDLEPDIILIDKHIPGIQRSEVLIFVRRLVRLNSVKVIMMMKSRVEFDLLQAADREHQDNYAYVESLEGLLSVVQG